jgi:hypothetical protein
MRTVRDANAQPFGPIGVAPRPYRTKACRTLACRRYWSCFPLSSPVNGSAETWPSGRRHTPAKGADGKSSRGFESLRLRHLIANCLTINESLKFKRGEPRSCHRRAKDGTSCKARKARGRSNPSSSSAQQAWRSTRSFHSPSGIRISAIAMLSIHSTRSATPRMTASTAEWRSGYWMAPARSGTL